MGPTASGKSALALDLARIAQADVINADALQVYGDLRVLSNRPGPQELAAAPHRLFGYVDGEIRYSVGAWLEAARAAIHSAWAAGRNVILAGGTGLYFKALTEGLVDAPPADPALRAALAEEAKQAGLDALFHCLRALDPASAARLAPADGPRILRALEIVIGTGQSLAVMQSQSAGALPKEEWRGVCLAPDRTILRDRIAARFAGMLGQGALDEAAGLAKRGLPPALPVMKALGVRWLIEHLAGELSLEAAESYSVRDTQRYAKRQRTWMAHQMPGWHRLDGSVPADWLEGALAAWTAPRSEHG